MNFSDGKPRTALLHFPCALSLLIVSLPILFGVSFFVSVWIIGSASGGGGDTDAAGLLAVLFLTLILKIIVVLGVLGFLTYRRVRFAKLLLAVLSIGLGLGVSFSAVFVGTSALLERFFDGGYLVWLSAPPEFPILVIIADST